MIFSQEGQFQGSFMVFHVLLLVFMVLKGSFVVFVWFSYFVQGIFWLVVLGFHAGMTNYFSNLLPTDYVSTQNAGQGAKIHLKGFQLDQNN